MKGWKRPFGWFWGARAISQFGDEVNQLALPWLVAGVTGSALAVGALQTLILLPSVVFGLHLGVLVDRAPRKRLMQMCDLLRFVLVGSIAAVAIVFDDEPSVAHLLVVGLLIGIASAAFDAASQPLMADFVPRESLVSANSKLSLSEGVAIIAGPPVAGIMIAAIGAAHTLGIDALTFLASAVLLLGLGRISERRIPAGSASLRDAISEGIVALVTHAQVRAMTILQVLGNSVGGVVVGLAVIFLQRTLGLSSFATGVIFAVNGIGVILAGAVAGRLSRRIGLGRAYIVGLGISAAGVVCVAAAQPGRAATGAGVGWGLIGLGVMLCFVMSNAYRQAAIRGHVLGRVTATSRMLANAATAIGALVGGVVGEVLSVRGALAGAAIIQVGIALYALSTPLNAPDPPELTSAMS